jgi:hypothetical protein
MAAKRKPRKKRPGKAPKTGRSPSHGKPGSGPERLPLPAVSPGRLVLRLLLWAVPVTLVWIAVTPAYNIFLVHSAENLLHLFESPDATDLVQENRHDVGVLRRDFPPERSRVSGFRVTDLHFPSILMGALFLAVPVPWRQRLANLGWASLISVFFHILLAALWVQFFYATQLGSWSVEHYGPAAREFWGMAKHTADLPIKLALPLVLWAFFYLRVLLPPSSASQPVR